MKKPLNHVLAPREIEIPWHEVKEMEIGCTVNFHGNDKYGEHQWVTCTVAGTPQKKFLTYRDSDGMIKKLPIRDYPNKYYTKVVGR